MGDMPMQIAKIRRFIEEEIWAFRLSDLPRWKSIAFKFLRVLVLAIRDFVSDNCYLRASAITFYSMLSVVPVVALLFAMAKGFGFDQTLKKYLLQNFMEQSQIINQIFIFAESMLQRAKGGMIAGVGVMILFYTVGRMFGNIETSLNHFWRVKKGRSMFSRITAALVLMLLAAVVLVFSSSANVLVATYLNYWLHALPLFTQIGTPLVMFTVKLLPFVMLWITFTLLYIYIPNTKVNPYSAFIAGVFSGSLFQILQESFILLQVTLSSYNAIYGSFSALPLFLIWLQLSWLIFLFGAELAFAHQNSENFEFEMYTDKISHKAFRTFAVKTAALLVRNFKEHRPAMTAHQISIHCHMSIGLTRQVLSKLILADAVVEGVSNEKGSSVYHPSCGIGDITVEELLRRVDSIGLPKIDAADLEFDRISLLITEIEDNGRRNAADLKLSELQVQGVNLDEV